MHEMIIIKINFNPLIELNFYSKIKINNQNIKNTNYNFNTYKLKYQNN